MSVKDILAQYQSPLSTTTEDGRMLARSLAEIEAELKSLSKSLSIPEITIPDIDLSGIISAIQELKSGAPGPLPPQNLDLNPVYRSYEDTAKVLKEVLGEVKTTNTRVASIRGGGTGPSIVGLNDADGHRLNINTDGSLPISGTVTTTSDALTDTQLRATPVSTSVTNFPATQPVTLPTRVYKTVTATAIVTAGTGYTTVVSFTPSIPVTICGYNGGYEILISSAAMYRTRLNVAGSVRQAVTYTAGTPSWSPVKYSVAAGELVTVTITHDQVTDTQFRATINYYEGA